MLLQDDRFDINARNCRSATPLHIASQNGAVEAVKMLCKAPKCDLNATNEWGESALHVAVQSAQSNCITVLLEAGCKTDLVDKWGQTPCEVIGICICALESCGLSPSKLPLVLFLYFTSLTYSFFSSLRIRSRLRTDYQILANGSSLL
jgi:ankyrin repeat protein